MTELPSAPAPTGDPPRLSVQSAGRPLLTAASLVVLVAGLKAAADLFVPVVLALFLALLTLPLVARLIDRGVRPGLAVLLAVLTDVAVVAAFLLLLSRALAEFAGALPGYAEALLIKVRAGVLWLEGRGLPSAGWQSALQVSSVVDVAGGIFAETVRRVTSFLGYTLLVILTTVFMIVEALVLPGKLRQALGGRPRSVSAQVLQITREIQRYLAIKTFVSFVTGVVVGLWLWFLGVEFPLFWGLVAFLFNYVPLIGSVVASIPTVLVTWVQLGSGIAILVALGYLAVNFVIGNLAEPHWMGRRFGLSTLVVFLSLGFWGWVWGPVGALLAVPLTMTLKIMLEHIEGLGWIAVLLGKGRVTESVPEVAAP